MELGAYVLHEGTKKRITSINKGWYKLDEETGSLRKSKFTLFGGNLPSRRSPLKRSPLKHKRSVKLASPLYDTDTDNESGYDTDDPKKKVRKLIKITNNCIERSNVPLKLYQKKVIEHIRKNKALLVVHATGLGKTLTALVASQCYLEKHPTHNIVVISPASVVHNFEKEMLKYSPSRKLSSKYSFYSFSGFMNLDKINSTRVDCEKTFLIIDEVHNLSNYESARYTAAMNCAMSAKKILLLTATPFVNKYEDFYSIINLLNRKHIIGPMRVPKRYKVKSSENIPGIYKHISQRLYHPVNTVANGNIVSDKIFELLMNKVDYEVNKETSDFPTVKMHVIDINMSMDYFDEYIKALHIDEFFGTSPKTFFHGYRRAVNKISNGYYSDKMDECLKYIKDKQSIIYSNWLEFGLKPICKILGEQGIKYGVISGDVDKDTRFGIVDKYNNKQIQVLVITKAGSEGLDLKETRSIVIMDPTWNPSTINQIVGRGVRYKSHENLHKKDRKVDVYFLKLINPIGTDEEPTGDEILYGFIEDKTLKTIYTNEELQKCSI